MKSLCIKTNNSNLIDYLLNELNYLKLDDICFVSKQFKHYNNIIIHYKGENNSLFIDKISTILSLLVIDELEEHFLNNILIENYFYFNFSERKEIIDICFDIMAENISFEYNKKFKILHKLFYDYLFNNHKLYLTGFTNFRLKPYLNILDDIVTEAVNSFVIEKEYLEFVSLLKLYINSQKSNCELIHIIYSDSNTILLDENKHIIDVSQNLLDTKILSDISFSTNDYTLNTLLTLLPKKIYIHLIDNYIDEFINTLQAIFESRVHICTDCNICKLYKKEISPNTI